MRWPMWICILVMLIAGMNGAIAGSPPPVCRAQSVLDVMSHQIKKRSPYGRIDPELVFEQPTARSTVLRCAVCVLVAQYEMLSLDDHPVLRCEAHVFDVQALPNGFVVRFVQ